MEKLEQKRHKILRYETDQKMIEKLQFEIEHLKNDLNKAYIHKNELYKLSLEYKALCEEEIKERKEIEIELERLKLDLLKKNRDIEQKCLSIQRITEENSKLVQSLQSYEKTSDSFHAALDSLFVKLHNNSDTEKFIREKLGIFDSSSCFDYPSSLLVKSIKLIEEMIPTITSMAHRKRVSYAEKMNNPLLSPSIAISINNPPNFGNNIYQNNEKRMNMNKSNSKETIYSLDTAYASKRSNCSSSKHFHNPTLVLYKQQKSVNQLV